MLWEKLIPEKLTSPSAVCGLDVVFSEEGMKLYYSLLKLKGGRLDLKEQGVCDQISDLPAEIRKNKLPLAISVSGKGIILKKIMLPQEAYTVESCMTSGFPAIHLEEFYVQLYPQRDQSAYLCLLRKEQMNDLLSVMETAKYNVAEIFIGPACISDVTLITSRFTAVQTAAYSLSLANDCVESVMPQSVDRESLQLDTISIQPGNLLSFATAFLCLLNVHQQEEHGHFLSDHRSRFAEKNKLKALTGAMMAVIFLACLINFLLFSHYFSANAKLDSELSIYENKYQQVNKLLGDYEKKKSLVEQAGVLNTSRVAMHADKIAALIPDEVVLCDWNFYPQKKSAEEDSLIAFQNQLMVIKGICNKSLVINDWMNILKSQSFIKEVSLEKFSYNSEGTAPNFEISIRTQP